MAANKNGFIGAQTTKYYKPSGDLIKQEIEKCTEVKGIGKVIDVPFVYATAETLQGFGRIVKDFDATDVTIERWPCEGREVKAGNLGGIAKGTFRCFWQGDSCLVENQAVKQKFIVGTRSGNDIFTTYANYHPDGTQIFYNADHTPFIIILAKPCPDDLIKPSDFVAFYCDGKHGIELNTGTWHQANFPSKLDQEVHLRNKQGKVHGVVEIVFDQEFDVHLRVQGAIDSVPSDELNLIPKSYPIADGHVERKKQKTSELVEVPGIFKVVNKHANQETLNGVAHVVDDSKRVDVTLLSWPQKEREMLYGNEAGVFEGDIGLSWQGSKLIVQNDEVSTGVEKGVKDGELELLFKRVFLNPDGSKVITHVDGASFQILLAKRVGLDVINPQDFALYTVSEGNGLNIMPNVWHSHPVHLTSAEETHFYTLKQNAIRAYCQLDFEAEMKSVIVASLTEAGKGDSLA